MPSSNYRDVNVVCPFYKSSVNPKKIRCEGCGSRSIGTDLIFKTTNDRDKHMAYYCDDIENRKNCPVHQMVEQKY